MNTEIPESEKLTFSQVRDIIYKYHKEHDIHYVSDRKELPILSFRIVFDPFASDWKKYQNKLDDNGRVMYDEKGNVIPDETKPITYSTEACTYEISDCDKYWFGECGGNSLYGFCMDKNELDSMGIRLDCYLDHWKILYCYQVKNKEKSKQ